MSFGQNIKKLRRDANMTQEHLAELLAISPQAVSRWETDAAMPDISLLPPLANLFNVTTDFLLGMDTCQKDARRAEFDEAFKDYWKKDDKEKNYRIAAQAAAEYPGEMKYLEWLASAELYAALSLHDDTAYHDMLEKSVKHYKMVLENCTEQKLQNQALHGVVLALHYDGRNAEAKSYAMQQEDEKERDELLNWCLEGEERKKHCQKVLDRKLNEFLMQIPLGQESVEAYDTVEQILDIMFPDGNFLHYHNTLQYNSIHKAFCLCTEKRYDEVIEELKKAKYHAMAMMRFKEQKTYTYTAKLFDLLNGKNEASDFETTDFEDFCECLNNNHCFDAIRHRDDFKTLYNA